MAGIPQAAIRENTMVHSLTDPRYGFIKLDLSDRVGMEALFASERFEAVVNLAGQAGVRYSIENPFAYMESNLAGFLTLLECCRRHPVRHLVYASSSSVYGMNAATPYREDGPADSPVSLYAATKKSNELMAHAYSHLYGIPATGLRFFTVYGPWGRPDMAPFLFLKSILAGEPIRVFNHGNMSRDFTFIDDIVAGLILVLDRPPVPHTTPDGHTPDGHTPAGHTDNGRTPDGHTDNGHTPDGHTPDGPTDTGPTDTGHTAPHRIYNIGHSDPVPLMDFIGTIEEISGRKAVLKMEEMQPGDVLTTCADTSALRRDFGYRPSTPLRAGLLSFYNWYTNFYPPSPLAFRGK